MNSRQTDQLSASVLVDLFDACFAGSDQTVLRGGAHEPFYRPQSKMTGPAVVFFRNDYTRSALHEVAHWCLAGRGRRQLPDYGYWYSPDDRDAEAQSAFFNVEARPQALESVFCDALGLAFSPSIDNLSLEIDETELAVFRSRLHAQRSRFLTEGLPARAARFHEALVQRASACPRAGDLVTASS